MPLPRVHVTKAQSAETDTGGFKDCQQPQWLQAGLHSPSTSLQAATGQRSGAAPHQVSAAERAPCQSWPVSRASLGHVAGGKHSKTEINNCQLACLPGRPHLTWADQRLRAAAHAGEPSLMGLLRRVLDARRRPHLTERMLQDTLCNLRQAVPNPALLTGTMLGMPTCRDPTDTASK